MKKFKIFQIFLYILLTCFSVVLFSIGIWITVDSAINAIYYDLTIEGSTVPNTANLWIIFVISYIAIALGLLLFVVSTTIVVKLENVKINKIILLINFVLMILALSCLILLANSDNFIKPRRLRDILGKVLKYKTANYRSSNEDKMFMDTIQSTVGCCGEINANVYLDNKYVPYSCKGFLGVGCVEKSLRYIDTRLAIYRGIYGTIFILQIIALFTSIKLLMKHSFQDSKDNQNNSKRFLNSKDNKRNNCT
ncbi:uncharacterized protein [Centruroides vittatus]|uniref:uncharacterized protein n=1 Tax=Centruroides vittatus TaxID=120091 RepID=UPI00351023A7